MTKKTLLLHVGTHKTATTTLQALMAQNRAGLAAKGFCYPATDRPPHPEHPKHNSLFAALLKGGDAFTAERDLLLREFDRSGCDTLVLSGEGLSSPAVRRSGLLAQMTAFQPDFDIRVICVLRRQDSFIESLWNQYAKSANTTKHITDFITEPKIIRHMTYMDTLDAWAEVASVTALGFEASLGAGIVESFAAATGIPLRPDPKSRNVSPSMTCAAIMAAMNRLDIRHDWRRIEKALGPDTRRHALGSRLRGELLARFADHNARLRQTYGVVFPDTMPDEPAEPIAEPGRKEILRIAEQMAATPAGVAGKLVSLLTRPK
ncbi:hypothetical protein RNZ50_00540 [Paracoccaceae bacterium Fryx2]|nr:hypothetical protein [Paracoccaceae bacterium Fryx2]